MAANNIWITVPKHVMGIPDSARPTDLYAMTSPDGKGVRLNASFLLRQSRMEEFEFNYQDKWPNHHQMYLDFRKILNTDPMGAKLLYAHTVQNITIDEGESYTQAYQKIYQAFKGYCTVNGWLSKKLDMEEEIDTIRTALEEKFGLISPVNLPHVQLNEMINAREALETIKKASTHLIDN